MLEAQEVLRRQIGATSLRDLMCGEVEENRVGQRIAICGWVSSTREHGEHLVFVDISDYTGVVQIVVEKIINIRQGDVVRVLGDVRERPPGTENEKISTGKVEMFNCEVEFLSRGRTLPFTPGSDVDEKLRLKYRYLDLRSQRLNRNLRFRAEMIAAIRKSLQEQRFLEVETPLLWVPTPEGAREFLVPSRLQKGNFYSLPQSPQIAKQLLMVAGFDRYYQIARCLRDEDLRSDRQFEFTQLDLEASFVTDHDIICIVNKIISSAVKLEQPDFELSSIRILTYAEAMAKYGSDKPDLRSNIEIQDLTDLFKRTAFKVLQADSVQGILFKGEMTRSDLDRMVEFAKSCGAKGLLWIRFKMDGAEMNLDSPAAKYITDAERDLLIERVDPQHGDTLFLAADERKSALSLMGAVRSKLIENDLRDDELQFCWVTDFPMFESIENGVPVPNHHPFTMYNLEDEEKLYSDPLAVRSKSYDLVLNGWELGSGSIRIHDLSQQKKIFSVIGITEEEQKRIFGFILEAFSYGAPPHGGFAIGLDRLVALLVGERSIREVIAFPKSQSGQDLMTGAPSKISPNILKALGIEVKL